MLNFCSHWLVTQYKKWTLIKTHVWNQIQYRNTFCIYTFALLINERVHIWHEYFIWPSVPTCSWKRVTLQVCIRIFWKQMEICEFDGEKFRSNCQYSPVSGCLSYLTQKREILIVFVRNPPRVLLLFCKTINLFFIGWLILTFHIPYYPSSLENSLQGT